MISVPAGARVLVATRPIDFRMTRSEGPTDGTARQIVECDILLDPGAYTLLDEKRSHAIRKCRLKPVAHWQIIVEVPWIVSFKSPKHNPPSCHSNMSWTADANAVRDQQ